MMILANHVLKTIIDDNRSIGFCTCWSTLH